MRLNPFILILLVGGLLLTAHPASADRRLQNGICGVAPHYDDGAFDRPMEFFTATTKGNSSTSVWIAMVGSIEADTPARFRAFLAELDGGAPDQIVLHSPGGNLTAGLDLGRIFREGGFTTHVGKTTIQDMEEDHPCRTWVDQVDAGICASACAYAFLGGKSRFLEGPYYPVTGGTNKLGFHQFYGRPDRGQAMLSPSEVEEIEATTRSKAQYLTGMIVVYAMEMGIDARVVALASATEKNDLYFPDESVLEELGIVTGTGLGGWFMEPYGDGLVTVARPRSSDSTLEQITAFCRSSDRKPQLLFTMENHNPHLTAASLSIDGIEIKTDGKAWYAGKQYLEIKTSEASTLITVPIGQMATFITSAKQIDFSLDAAHYIGGFIISSSLDEVARKSLALAWKNCL